MRLGTWRLCTVGYCGTGRLQAYRTLMISLPIFVLCVGPSLGQKISAQTYRTNFCFVEDGMKSSRHRVMDVVTVNLRHYKLQFVSFCRWAQSNHCPSYQSEICSLRYCRNFGHMYRGHFLSECWKPRRTETSSKPIRCYLLFVP